MRLPIAGTDKDAALSGPEARSKALEKDIRAAKRGDWEARHRVERNLQPLLKKLAEKRTDNISDFNNMIEAGKAGIATALRKVKQDISGDRFQIFALPFIEQSMDKSGKPGFFQRLFGGR
jgi:DNA-directed RNA polymerase specialized sigma subunit